MILPNTPEVVQKVADMGSIKIGLHVQFEPTYTNGQSSVATESAVASSDSPSSESLLKPSGSLSRAS